MRLHLSQLAGMAGYAIDVERLQGPAWNEASRISFKGGNSVPLATAIEGALASVQRQSPLTASLSDDAKLVYAALASKVDREMTNLPEKARADLRTQIARDLVRKEMAEGPVVLSDEQRRAATAPSPEPTLPRQSAPTAPRPRR